MPFKEPSTDVPVDLHQQREGPTGHKEIISKAQRTMALLGIMKADWKERYSWNDVLRATQGAVILSNDSCGPVPARYLHGWKAHLIG